MIQEDLPAHTVRAREAMVDTLSRAESGSKVEDEEVMDVVSEDAERVEGRRGWMRSKK